MKLPVPLIRAVITACLAETTDQARRELLVPQEAVRVCAEDAIVYRIMDALNECGSVHA